jgi:hypothetical protein
MLVTLGKTVSGARCVVELPGTLIHLLQFIGGAPARTESGDGIWCAWRTLQVSGT